jgi:Spy/CpxP family protein refolding chaperone
MRKSMMIGGLALVFGAATLSAQPPQDQHAHRPGAADSTFRGRRGPGGGPERMLLKGITLTDAQKQQLATLRQQERQQMQGQREAGRSAFEEIRVLRQRGDTAAAKAKMEQLRAQMQQRRAQQIAALRNVLTPEQRKQLDANVAELKQWQSQHQGREGGAWRGERSQHAGA